MVLVSMSIGVMAINALTGLGEGAKQFILSEFSLLGNNTLILLPGKKETTGGMPPITGEAPQPLTLEDCAALARLPDVLRVAPLMVSGVEVSYRNRSREVITAGTHADFFTIRQLKVTQGRKLPLLRLHEGRPVAILGAKLKQELFGNQNPLGKWVRANDRRFRVIGILEDKGQALGMDMSDFMLIPTPNAQTLFNREGLFRVFIEIKSPQQIESAKQTILSLMKERHNNIEDVTLISQDSMLSAFSNILNALTIAVAGIGAISLLVAGILIMNVMLITVTQRTTEIGLLKALGASANRVRQIFLLEAAMLATAGASIGLLVSAGLMIAARHFYPNIPFQTPAWAQVISVLVAMITALLFAFLPANRAAHLPPVEALLNRPNFKR